MSKGRKKAKKGKGKALPAAGDIESRAYEAAMAVPHRRHVIGANLSQDAAFERAGGRLRNWGRFLDENDDSAVGVLDELVKNVVGSGIVTIPKPLRPDGQVDEVLGEHLMQRWKRWRRKADVTGELSWHEAQRLICRAWLRDGDHFLQHVGAPYPFTIDETPYRLEMLESEMVPWDFEDRDRGWRQGIQHDTWRRPLNYAVYLEHPGDFTSQSMPVTFQDLKIVPVERMTHLKCVKRWPATRGVSVLHPVIARLYDIHDLEESERLKNRILASWCAAVVKNPDVPGNEQKNASGDRFMQMAGGTIIDSLAANESIVGVGPDYPVANMPDHIADQYRRVASGTGTRYSSIAKNYNGTYSAQRQEMVESEGHYKMREDVFVDKVCREVYERWVFVELLSGTSALSPGQTPEMAANAEYRGPVTPWIDPKTEIEADAMAVEYGFASQEQVQIKRGASEEIIGQRPSRQPTQLSLVPRDEDEEAA